MVSEATTVSAERWLEFEVRRDDLSQVRVIESEAPAPDAGEAVFAIERFGLSANNLTYALLGDRFGYWRLFPTADGWGQIPVWAELRVLDSRVKGVEVGWRAYGLAPMATHLVTRPERIGEFGFTDGAAHRRHASRVYNAYSWLDDSPADPDPEALRLVIRPLFWLSFMLDDLLREEAVPADCSALITSASSKAAIGAAYLLRARGVAVIGLTSHANGGFVTSLGVYDDVVSYDRIADCPAGPTVLLDIAGSREVREAVERRFGGSLARTVIAGSTHRDAAGAVLEPTAARTSFLSVPDQMTARVRDLGWDELNRRYLAALGGFVAFARRWLRIEPVGGTAAVELAYRETLTNAVPPDRALVLTMGQAH